MTKNPLEEYVDDYLDKDSAVHINLAPPGFPTPPNAIDERRIKEHELWHTWNNNGRKPEHLQPLMESMKPLIVDSMKTWKGRVRYIPDEALESEFNNQAVNAFKTFDPDRGANLGTWVKTNLRKSGRFVRTYQNVGRIVEDRTGHITTFNTAKADLATKYGRPATDAEMVDHLNSMAPDTGKQWSPAEVQRMNSELRADIMTSTFQDDPSSWSPHVDDEIMAHLHEELNPQERQVFQYIQKPGVTKGKTGLIAQQLGWSPSKVSRMRKAIEQKAQYYRGVLGTK